jgi:SAP domain
MEASAAALADGASTKDRYAAFAVSDEHQGLTGATCSNPITGETIDLMELLADTNHGNVDGLIVTDDPIVADACTTMPAFTEADVPASFDPPAPAGDEPPADFDSLLKADLVDLCTEYGLPTDGTKPELVDRLEQWRARQQTGAQPVGAEAVAIQHTQQDPAADGAGDNDDTQGA